MFKLRFRVRGFPKKFQGSFKDSLKGSIRVPQGRKGICSTGFLLRDSIKLGFWVQGLGVWGFRVSGFRVSGSGCFCLTPFSITQQESRREGVPETARPPMLNLTSQALSSPSISSKSHRKICQRSRQERDSRPSSLAPPGESSPSARLTAGRSCSAPQSCRAPSPSDC